MESPIASRGWLIGAWLAVGGIIELAIALSARAGRRWLFLVAAINILLGGFLLTLKPAEAFLLLGYLVGFSFLLRGVWSIAFVGRIHHITTTLTGARA